MIAARRTTALGSMRVAVSALAAITLLAGCGRNMVDQPKAQPYEASAFLPGGSANQVPPVGTISREAGNVDPAFYTGLADGGLAQEVPFDLTIELMLRGQERYGIYCAPCHGYDGAGNGMIVQKGFPQPASFNDARLLSAPVGYFYSAATNGFGRMYSYASRIPTEDRWAIAAYVKAMQLSQNAFRSDVPDDVLADLESSEGEAR